MCNFFSFCSDGNGKPIYFTANQRKTLKNIESFDSHSLIAKHFLDDSTKEDQLNKYEYSNGNFKIDQINTTDDSKYIELWLKDFVKTKQFQDICLAAVKQYGYALQYVKKQTPAICLAAVKQDGYALEYVKKQNLKEVKEKLNIS